MSCSARFGPAAEPALRQRRPALGEDFGVELTFALDDFRFPPDANELLRVVPGAKRTPGPALYTMAELDAAISSKPAALYVMHVRDGNVATITALKLYRALPDVSAASVERPESADSALLGYELVDSDHAEGGLQRYFTPLTSIWALAELHETGSG